MLQAPVPSAPTCGHLLAQLGGACPVCAAARAAAIERSRPRAVPPLDLSAGVVDLDDLVLAIARMPAEQALKVLAALPADVRRAVARHPDFEAESMRRSASLFVREACANRVSGLLPRRLEWGPHLDALCMHFQGQLEDAERCRDDLAEAERLGIEPVFVPRAQRMIVNTPPRSFKTAIATLMCAWAWTRWPWLQILYLSANPRVASDSARMFRDIVSSPWYQDRFVRGRWQIRDDQDALLSIGNTEGGARRSRGMAADVIGENADHVVLDDAHSMDDSPEKMLATIENFDGNIASRLNDQRWGTIAAIMQRAKRRDFSDHAITQRYFHVRIPMEFERRPECKCEQCQQGARGEPNAFGWKDWRTAEGEVIHPRYTPAVLAEARRRLKHNYAGQMQQRPADRQGEIFKLVDWRYAQVNDGDPNVGNPKERPHGAYTGAAQVIGRDRSGKLEVDWVCLSVDPTGGSDKEEASALGMLTIVGLGERRITLHDHTPGPATWGQTKKLLREALIKLSDITGWTRRILVLIEKKALGPSAISEVEEWIAEGLKNSLGKKIHARVEAYEPSGKGSKDARADHLEPMLDSHLLYFLDGAPWLLKPNAGCDDTIIDEFAAFGPRRKSRDDRVDCLAQCCDHYREGAPGWVRYFKDRDREREEAIAEAVVSGEAPKKQRRHEHTWVDGKCRSCGFDPAAPAPPMRPATPVVEESCRCGEGRAFLPSADPRTKECSRCGLVQDEASNGF